MNIENGVKEYIKGTCEVQVYFPVNAQGKAEINCNLCKFFSRASGICYLTKEVSEYPSKYIGSHCPLEFAREEIEKANNIVAKE